MSSARAAVSGRPTTPATRRAEEVLRAFHEEAALGKAYDWGLLLKLWPYVAPYKRLVWLSLVVILLTSAGAVVRPLLMKWVIDDGVTAKDSQVVFRGGLAFAVLILVEQVLAFAQIYAVQIVGARSMADLRWTVFRFLHSLKLRFFDTQPVGRLVTRVTNDIDAILELFSSGALNAFGDLIRLLGIVVLMMSLNLRLSLVAFAAGPPVALIVLLVRRRMRGAFREIRLKTARMNANMSEQVSGIAVIQAFGREQQAGREFDEINVAYRDANLKSIKYEAMQDAAIEAVASISLASIIVAIGYQPASFGTVVAFAAYLTQFFEPISALAQRYTLLQSALAGAERVFGLLESEDFDLPERAAQPDGDASLDFELCDVEFSYKQDAVVLKGVSLQAKPGEKIALVGPTGAGKSTIVQLILRLYGAQSGVVRVRGKDVNAYERSELRRLFSVVPQDVFLFKGTLAENISAGVAPDEERVEATLRRLSAYELLAERRDGIHTPVDEHGSNFSAGERQLIAFARALYRDAPIVILDEATANVDSATEAKIQTALKELLKGRTALIIAHRLSTIREADRIVVLRQGAVVERGTHAELLQQEGLYAALYRLQFSRADG